MHEDMPSSNLSFMVLQLNVDLDCQLVKNKRRTFNAKRSEAIIIKVDKLLKAGFIKEVP